MGQFRLSGCPRRIDLCSDGLGAIGTWGLRDPVTIPRRNLQTRQITLPPYHLTQIPIEDRKDWCILSGKSQPHDNGTHIAGRSSERPVSGLPSLPVIVKPQYKEMTNVTKKKEPP